MSTADTPLCDRIGGLDVVLALCRRWHALCLEDPIATRPFDRVPSGFPLRLA